MTPSTTGPSKTFTDSSRKRRVKSTISGDCAAVLTSLRTDEGEKQESQKSHRLAEEGHSAS